MKLVNKLINKLLVLIVIIAVINSFPVRRIIRVAPVTRYISPIRVIRSVRCLRDAFNTRCPPGHKCVSIHKPHLNGFVNRCIATQGLPAGSLCRRRLNGDDCLAPQKCQKQGLVRKCS
jgi:hypothetical protein